MDTRITYGTWRLRPSRFSKSRLKPLDLLRKASGLGLLNPLFRNDPHFKPLHADPPFLGMLADLRYE
jgi:hypothetical protein